MIAALCVFSAVALESRVKREGALLMAGGRCGLAQTLVVRDEGPYGRSKLVGDVDDRRLPRFPCGF